MWNVGRQDKYRHIVYIDSKATCKWSWDTIQVFIMWEAEVAFYLRRQKQCGLHRSPDLTIRSNGLTRRRQLGRLWNRTSIATVDHRKGQPRRTGLIRVTTRIPTHFLTGELGQRSQIGHGLATYDVNGQFEGEFGGGA